MDETKRELNFEEMSEVVGGTQGEAKAYLEHLMQKYGTRDIKELRKLVTKEEKQYHTYVLNHRKGDPLKPYPN